MLHFKRDEPSFQLTSRLRRILQMTEKEDYTLILRLLALTLIEIRGSDDMRTMKGMADCFHNVPYKIITNTKAEEILQDVLSVADRYGKKDFMKRFIEGEARRHSLPLKWVDE